MARQRRCLLPEVNGGFRDGIREKWTLQVMARMAGIPHGFLGTLLGLLETSLVWLDIRECVEGEIWKGGPRKAEAIHFVSAKGFEAERDMAKGACSGSYRGSRVTPGVGEIVVTWLVGGYWKGSGQS
uniref:Uncharacterized protein n=1 Tax=Molossus molossus TaxID=27622 RepID=A0A7J8JW74_MOLMO|nr:hypothetical protein HJG59_007817 [Molossus molossus]